MSKGAAGCRRAWEGEHLRRLQGGQADQRIRVAQRTLDDGNRLRKGIAGQQRESRGADDGWIGGLHDQLQQGPARAGTPLASRLQSLP
ncbi:MAG: hypothetical protein V3T83_11875 [Acidobacteriota bacterium]